MSAIIQPAYRGRLAPSPTGYLHLGHARTFWIAQQRCLEHKGTLILRNEDLDHDRCRAEFEAAMLEDLRWFGLRWHEGPDCGGAFGPYSQSLRRKHYVEAFERLRAGGFIYPCRCSRRDVARAMQAPHQGEEEPVYPGTCRGNEELTGAVSNWRPDPGSESNSPARSNESRISWRFRVPDGEELAFVDGCTGGQSFTAGRDFGDFIVWRHDDVPSYQLAVAVDDGAMHITEVVRGSDLLLSTARQLLLYRALNLPVPSFYHCPLMTDEHGVRLAKRHDSLSLRELRSKGVSPESLRNSDVFRRRASG